jgi:acetyl esterase
VDELDPQTRTVIMAMRGLWPDLGGGVTDVGDARRAVEALPDLGAPPEVGRVETRLIEDGDGGPMRVRIVWPLGVQADARASVRHEPNLPVVVYFHGGGWVLGGLETHDHLVRELSNAVGAVVVSVDYRLAPEHPFPAAVHDAWAATCYVAQHAAELGADPGRVAVAGDSAGGNLAAVTALRAREERGPDLAYQLLICPVTDCDLERPSYREPDECFFLTRTHMQWYWDLYVADPARRTDPWCAPLRAEDLSGLPPAYVGTAELDPLRDEGREYAERMAASGGDVEHRCFAGLAHGFSNVSELLPPAAAANAAMFAAARNALERAGS